MSAHHSNAWLTARVHELEAENKRLESTIRTGIAVTRQTAAQEQAKKLEDERHTLQPHHSCAAANCEIADSLMKSIDERNSLEEKRDSLAVALERVLDAKAGINMGDGGALVEARKALHLARTAP